MGGGSNREGGMFMKAVVRHSLAALGVVVLVGGAVAAGGVLDLTPKQASLLLQQRPSNPHRRVVVLDVRTPEEFRDGHIRGAVNLDFYSPAFRERLARLDRKRTYLIHCARGGRSAGAVALAKELGFRKVYHLPAGMSGWRAAGLPVVRE